MVLVVGAAGAFGAAVVRALVQQRVAVRALVRRPVDLPGVDVRIGDAMHLGDLLEASEGCDTIVHAANTRWHAWDPTLLKITTACLDCARERDATVVFPTTVDGLKPIFDVPLPVPPPRADVSDPLVHKGDFRVMLENHVAQFVEELGGRAIVVRCNDFFGPGVVHRPFGPTQAALIRGGPAPWYGPLDVPRALTFVEDAASLAVAALGAARPAFVELAAPCHVRRPAEWAAAFGGKGTPVERKAWEVRLKGLWDAEDREQVELMYKWNGPMLFADHAVKALLPDWAPLPFDAAIRRTLGAA